MYSCIMFWPCFSPPSFYYSKYLLISKYIFLFFLGADLLYIMPKRKKRFRLKLPNVHINWSLKYWKDEKNWTDYILVTQCWNNNWPLVIENKHITHLFSYSPPSNKKPSQNVIHLHFAMSLYSVVLMPAQLQSGRMLSLPSDTVQILQRKTKFHTL